MPIEQANCIRRFMRICNDGWEQGWHERNGGNLTYRMTQDDVAACAPFFRKPQDFGPWVDLGGVTTPSLAGQFFITTGSGKYMRKVNLDLTECVGIIELNATGSAYRIVWGLRDGGRPTSELPTHILNHEVRAKATGDTNRIIYHAHCTNVIVASTILPSDARTWSRMLWKSMTECVVIFPEGVGVVPWMVPGGADIAKASAELMADYAAVVWSQHGLFVSGDTFDDAFGLMHTIEKAAGLYLSGRAAMGGAEPPYLISDDQLRAVGVDFNVTPNPAFLD